MRKPRAEPRRCSRASVDRFGWPVAGAGSVQVGQHVDGTFPQGPPERERGDDLEHRLRVVGREQASGEAIAQFGHSVSLLTPL